MTDIIERAEAALVGVTDEYQIRVSGATWQTVSREEWIRAERRAGFYPKCGGDAICATGGFSGAGIEGRIASAALTEASHDR